MEVAQHGGVAAGVEQLRSHAIFELDGSGTLRDANEGVASVFGYAQDALVGQNMSLLFSQADVQRDQAHCLLLHAATHGAREWDGAMVRRDGSRFRASVVVEQVSFDPYNARFIMVVRDVTKMYEAQKRFREAEEMTLRAQRLDSVSKLTLGLAHDFNNLLTVIVNSLDMLAARRAGDESTRRILDIAHNAVDRGSMLTRQMLAFGRGQTLVPELHDINTLLSKSRELFGHVCGDGIEVSIELAEGLPAIMVDPVQLEAAIFNLLGNSRDAMCGAGRIVISTAAQRLAPSAQAAEADFIAITVGDSGPGIGAELQDSVFEPFFTTKGVGEGSGLGLSQVYGFAAQSGGMARIGTSALGGASVALYLPVQQVAG